MNILIQKLHYKINDYNNEAKIVIFPFCFLLGIRMRKSVNQ